ncbi:solute:Na+ symporter, SSS family [Alicyclobacillus macrosporangiidus]|uniref:Solute:Na+ symporter, SSS family n=1 Tax=Alicyclobacillus macrosporangiidus TaxID=392015 RepID=A0A1I7KIB8_9BACL|nr:solute:Na+ symporter, SSS family [Alicyclobacillus macrosporangiidus]
MAGLITGWGVTAYLVLTQHDPVAGWNAGLVALIANLVMFFVVSALTKPVPRPYLDDFYADAFPAATRPSPTRAPDLHP